MSSSECASVEVVRLGRANSQLRREESRVVASNAKWIDVAGRSEAMHTLERRLNNSLLQQIRTILVNVPRIREGDPDAIHDARVATRRIRAVRSVTRGLSPKGTYEVFRAMIRRLRPELGLVRDLDMILDVVNAAERGN